MYIYPDNLKGQSTLLLWTLRDIVGIVIGTLLSVAMLVVLNFMISVVATAVFAFLTLRIDNELNIADYIRFAVRYFITTQQLFYWWWDD